MNDTRFSSEVSSPPPSRHSRPKPGAGLSGVTEAMRETPPVETTPTEPTADDGVESDQITDVGRPEHAVADSDAAAPEGCIAATTIADVNDDENVGHGRGDEVEGSCPGCRLPNSDDHDDADDAPSPTAPTLALAEIPRYYVPEVDAPAPDVVSTADHRRQFLYTPGNLAADVHDISQILLAVGAPLFVYGNHLVTVDSAGAASVPGAKVIQELTAPHLASLLSLHIQFVRPKADHLVPMDAPAPLVKAILLGPTWPFPPLRRLVDIPTMLPDGSILSDAGYNPVAQTFYSPDPTLDVPEIPDTPTPQEAQQALALLQDLVGDCLFAGDCDRAAALTAIATPVVRSAIDGCVPAFVVQAAVSRIGKSELVQFVSLVATGHPAKVQPPRSDTEMEKRITGHVKVGDKLVAFDNGAAPLGGPAIEAAVTSRIWVGRVLGSNQLFSGPMEMTLFFTGNNVTYHIDMLGRVVVIRLETELENLGDRPLRRPDAQAWALENRGRLIAAVLTICRAYMVAGSPDMGLPALAGFGQWNRVVRSAFVWAGEADPLAGLSQLKAESDPETEAFGAALDMLANLFPDGQRFTARMVFDLLKGPPPTDGSARFLDPLAEALHLVLGARPVGLGALRLGHAIKKLTKRTVGGLHMKCAARTSSGNEYVVDRPSER